MKVLLTGATGFIGQHVLGRLVKRGDRVRVLALPETAHDVRHLDPDDIVAGSLADRGAVGRACRGIEVVVHMAAEISGISMQRFQAVNVQGTRNLLAAATGAAVNRFVYLSSTSVYGLAPFPAMWPIDERSPLAAHGHPNVRLYGASKIQAEALVREAGTRHHLEYVILRPTVVYGSGAERARKLLFTLLPRPSPVWFEFAPHGVVQWLHVHDLVRLLLLTMDRRDAANETFNGAGPEAVSVRQLSRDLRAELGLLFGPARPWALPFIVPPFSMEHAADVLGFEPSVAFPEGLHEMFGGAARDMPSGGGNGDSLRWPRWVFG